MPGTRIRHTRPTKRARAKSATLGITSASFQDGERMPERYVRSGANLSPALSWSRLPEGTASIAVICEDPDAPRAEPFIHWVVFNIPGPTPGVPEGVAQPPGSEQGVNDFGNVGYDGPEPPAGHGPHRYFFQVYALDTVLPLRPGVTTQALRAAMEGHVVAEGRLVGKYSR